MSQKPVPTGEYSVGTRTFTVYNTRKETLDKKGDSMRHVSARIYYPVLKDSVKGFEKAKAISRSEAKGIKKAFKIPLNYDKMEAEGANDSECYTGAPFIEGKKFPLIVFNHGYFSYIEGNSFLLTDLASHGYVILSVGHPLEAAGTDFDDGTYELCDTSLSTKLYHPFIPALFAAARLTKMKGTNEELAERFDAFQNRYCEFHKIRVKEWMTDTGFAVDHFLKEYADIIDLSNGIGCSGHSMGGAAAYALCQLNDKYSCGINIDGGLFGQYDGMVMRKPFMMLSCKDNENVVVRGYIRHSAPAFKVLFQGMRHVGFSDMKYAIKAKSMVGKLSPESAHDYTCKCHLEFFDAYLKKIKNKPALESNSDITVTEYASDM